MADGDAGDRFLTVAPALSDRIEPGVEKVEIYLDEARHGFNRDVDASYNQQPALAARERAVEFLKLHLKKQRHTPGPASFPHSIP